VTRSGMTQQKLTENIKRELEYTRNRSMALSNYESGVTPSPKVLE
jgi:hypothetical protein